MDAASLTHSNPYEEMNEYLRLCPERQDAMRRTLSYFDCINFAPRIKAHMLVSVGLGDDVCPPETGFDLVNAMTCAVEFRTFPRCAHDAGSYWNQARVESFLAEHLHPAAYEGTS